VNDYVNSIVKCRRLSLGRVTGFRFRSPGLERESSKDIVVPEDMVVVTADEITNTLRLEEVVVKCTGKCLSGFTLGHNILPKRTLRSKRRNQVIFV
jgi:hypothetical protein